LGACGTGVVCYRAGTSPETLYVKNGTVSSILVYHASDASDAVQVYTTTNVALQLDANEGVSIVYSVLPTALKDIH
jgi:hypothetical protein